MSYQVTNITSDSVVQAIHIIIALKLGHIPLRHLVYRVHNLPPSMRPLVYDFGQLNPETEFRYTSKVVENHVRNVIVISV